MLGSTLGEIERAIARGLAAAYPWLAKVQRLPGGGIWCPAPSWWPDAANDSKFCDD